VTPSITLTPTPSVGWDNIFEFTIDTTKQNNNSSSTSSFEFSRTNSSFLSPDPGNITIYWGDGSSDNPYITRNHTYSSPGIYTIKVASLSTPFYDKIGIEFANTATPYSEGDACKVISVSRIPSYTYIQPNTFTACRNLTGFTGQAQNSQLPPNCVSFFRDCTSLTSGVSNFDSSLVTTMFSMFESCISFNEDISGWDTSNVTNMNATFYSATTFNQNLGSWNISSLTQNCTSKTSMVNMFGLTNLQKNNYDQILNGWASQTSIPSCINLFGVPCGYTTAGQASRNLLTGTYLWQINDGGLVP
jgi:surface protein